MNRLEFLLSLVNIQSTTRQPVESPSTAPLRMTRQDALAELSYAMQGENRLRVAAALMRWAPELLSSAAVSELRVAVRDAVLVYGLTLRPRLPDSKMPKAVLLASACAMNEHADWCPCSKCSGNGTVHRMSQHAGEGLILLPCPKCSGIGWHGWSTLKRARKMGLHWTTAARARCEMAAFGVSLLDSWCSEGVSEIARMREAAK